MYSPPTTCILQIRSGSTTDSVPDELPPSSKLQAGYIRYVRILPGFKDESSNSIRCETRICRSSKRVSYNAISYAWGGTRRKYPITVDGQTRLIAGNLCLFLRQAKTTLPRFSRWLWIDALCIDQADAAERMHQVAIMAKIFGRADQVIV